LRAVVFSRNCGATVAFTTQVAVLGFEESLGARAGNLFICDFASGTGGDAVAGPKVHVSWKGDNALHVEHHRYARVFKQEAVVRRVRANYAAVE